VAGTNSYAKEKGVVGRRKSETAAGVHPWGQLWRKVMGSEMRVFLALLIYMGGRHECGSSGSWRRAGEKVFQTMSLGKRFSQIKRYIHISDQEIQL